MDESTGWPARELGKRRVVILDVRRPQLACVVCVCVCAQVKIQQDTGSPTLWGDACCVMLSGTLDNVVKAQQMILERIANTSDRLKELVSQPASLSCVCSVCIVCCFLLGVDRCKHRQLCPADGIKIGI